MGLFDAINKNRKETCTECFRTILREGKKWNGRTLCKACYEATVGKTSEQLEFEMTVEAVFTIKNHGVVLTGLVNKGNIRRNDVVWIHGTAYTVILIDVMRNTGPGEAENAERGMNAALHLSTMDASPFRRGDRITGKRL